MRIEFEKNLDELMQSLRNHANDEYELARKKNDYEQGYWRGYLDALNDIFINKTKKVNED